MKRPQFALRRLFLLIAGVAMLCYICGWPVTQYDRQDTGTLYRATICAFWLVAGTIFRWLVRISSEPHHSIFGNYPK